MYFIKILFEEKPLIEEKRALKDLNPRHLILETSVLPTELRTHGNYISNIIFLYEKYKI
jgi:hypothetical protein